MRQGWCWWHRKYAPGDTVLGGLEKHAREGRRLVGRSSSYPTVGLSQSQAGAALALQKSEHRVRHVNVILAEQNRRALGMISRGSPSKPLAFLRLSPRIRLPARPLCPSRFVPSVASLCNVPSRTTHTGSSSCRWPTFSGFGSVKPVEGGLILRWNEISILYGTR